MRHDVTFKELKITDPVPVSWWHAKCSCGAQGSAYTSKSVAQVWKKEHLREVGVEHRIISRSTVINTSSQPKHSASCRCGETSPVFNNANKLEAWEKDHIMGQNSNAEKLEVWEIRKGDRVFIQNNADGCGYFSAGDIISVGQRSRYARADEASWVNGSGLLIHKECWPLRILPNDVKTVQAGWVVAEIQRDFTLGPVEKVALSFPTLGKMFVLFEPMKKQETLEERVERLENRCCKCCADS